MPAKSRYGSAASILAGAAITFAALGAAAFYGPQQIKDPIWKAYDLLYARLFPCSRPETYSFGAFDARFGISRADFAAAVTQAMKLWEAPIGHPLFTHVETGGALTIDLVYDYRQEATDKLRRLGVTLGDDRATYDRLRASLDAMEAQLKTQKAAYDAAVSDLDARKAAYDREVAQANARGGASKQEYAQLQAERDAINAEVARVNAMGAALNALVDQINSTVTVINRLAQNLNLAASNYNGVVGARGQEFEEGLFTGNDAGGTIDIYEFEDRAKLVRVLAHELGHALGLPHLDDPAAIMYRLNSGTNASLSAADIAALKSRCGIK